MEHQEFIPRSERLKQKSKDQSSLPSRAERHRKKDSEKSSHKDWILALVVSLVLAFVIRGFVLEPFHVSGPSMQQTLSSGDQIMVNKLIYKFRDPKFGEIVVFHNKDNRELIKRVIALPGETVEAKNNRVLINGKEIQETYLSSSAKTDDFAQVKVPDGKVFVLGDNRTNSTDSRSLGPISVSEIIGKASLVYWPFTHFSGL